MHGLPSITVDLGTGWVLVPIPDRLDDTTGDDLGVIEHPVHL
jgi:hypothetical protein